MVPVFTALSDLKPVVLHLSIKILAVSRKLCKKSILPVKDLSDEVLAWLSLWSKVQITCIWFSWCDCRTIILLQKNPGWFVLLVPAYPRCPGKKAVKQMLLLLTKLHEVFKWKDTTSGFHVSRGSAEALVRSCGKLKHHDFLCSQYYFYQKSSKSIYVCWSHSKSKLWTFLSHSVYISSDVPASVVWSVCLLGTTMSFVKMADLIEMGCRLIWA